jgi:hypothetical protein
LLSKTTESPPHTVAPAARRSRGFLDRLLGRGQRP